ncbi:alpha/beta fold hydrolase [Novosphingobium bradum]|uniref:Alpha/beta fold hydrolase n=1 Tax=Novosphingobium bradum TaxID=1737444 RepID=A0ABV7ITW1_9SPHN
MDIPGPTSHSFVSQRLRLRYVDWGNPDAPPLILQHGGRDHCRSWDWAAQELRKDWHVICPDLRGHGDSDWSSDGDYAMSSYVYDFAQLIHTLGYDQVTVVAHSLGGTVTSRYAGVFPERVRKLVNIEGLGLSARDMEERSAKSYGDRFREWVVARRRLAAVIPSRYPTIEAACARMKEANPFLSDAQVSHLTIHAANRNEDGTWSWKFDPALRVFNPFEAAIDDIHELWPAITCPVLLLWGHESFFDTPDKDGRMDFFRDARLKVYDKAGHWLHHDQFDQFMADVSSFLAE